MAILEGIRIQNYRALKDVTLGKVFDNEIPALTRLVAVIGANGTGKSSLVDAFEFLGDCLREGVQAACDKPHRGGFERMRTQGCEEGIWFYLRYRENTEDRPIIYSVSINCNQNGMVYISDELLQQTESPLNREGKPLCIFNLLDLKNGEGNAYSTDMAINPITSKPIGQSVIIPNGYLGICFLMYPIFMALRDYILRWYLSYFEPKLSRIQPISGFDPHLDRTGENLANYLQFVERDNPTGFSEMLQRIARKIPGIQGIKPIKAPDRRLLLEFTVEGFDNPLYQQDMSDGTLKMLAYLSLMEDPNPAPLIGIEEPENGLYPLLLGKLTAEFSAYAEQPGGPQILVTTHSQNFVDALSPEDVWILDKGEDGFSRLLRTADIRGVPELYEAGLPMGSLWYSNHFGTDKP